ncbi:hypothetical protein Bpfe_024074 [Biomphalaria pfeifferi]|uniref:Uncharacterized protein n=1 Tax=Biomphalaria pfeifferi TaxID=112525 RepID=A0AAD8B210_BIOPF|nr:hypothetical protein Bpfe_024074 [Biomphalaria pfeifferi]
MISTQANPNKIKDSIPLSVHHTPTLPSSLRLKSCRRDAHLQKSVIAKKGFKRSRSRKALDPVVPGHHHISRPSNRCQDQASPRRRRPVGVKLIYSPSSPNCIVLTLRLGGKRNGGRDGWTVASVASDQMSRKLQIRQ